MTSETLNITGMTCVSCAANIRISLEKKDGVKKIDVNFASKKAFIEFDENKIGLEEIKKTIIANGFNIENSKDNQHQHINQEEKIQKIKVIIAILMTLPLFLRMFWKWEMPGDFLGVSFTNWLQHDLAFIIVFITGWQFHSGAYKQIKKLQTSMDTLISLGTLSAYFYSLWAMFHTGHIYFESAATITALILFGKYLELKTTNKASQAMEKLMELGAKKAKVLLPNGQEEEKDINDITIGDVFIVRAGEKIALDGVVIEGKSTVDEAMLTGESMPVAKFKDTDVFGATININGILKIKVTKNSSDTMLSQIIKTVEEAQNFKAPIQKLADKISSIFVPTVVSIAILTFLGWFFTTGEVGTSLIHAVTVLIISCPCALGIATPIAIMIGTSVGARNGILIKNGESFEKAKNVNTVAFDKTGTLTVGKPKIQKIISSNKELFPENKILKIAASLASNSNHPISKAVTNHIKDMDIELAQLDNFQENIGKGISGNCRAHKTALLLGNIKLLKDNNLNSEWAKKLLQENKKTGNTIIFATHGENVMGAIFIADEIKKTAVKAIAELKNISFETVLMSGDNHATTKTVAEKIGIKKYLSEVLPQDKQTQVKKLQEKNAKVVFVGDGVNDAPSLIQSDLGIAMGSGTDIAKESGDIIIMQNDPIKVVEAIKLSKKTFNIIKQNLFWAFFYNILAIPLAIAGLVNPMVGAIAMSLSDITIIGNSLRIYKK